MSKIAGNQHPIHEIIKNRWSPRAFADKLVPQSDVLSVLEAAHWAPSSRNEQPWHFIVATKDHPQEFDRLLDCLADGNIRWSQDVPMLLLAVAKMHFDYKHRPNRHAWHDLGLALANLFLQATALGLYAHPMAGFSVDKAHTIYDIPEDYQPATAVAIGYLGDPDQLDDDLREREVEPRARKPLSDFIFFGAWQKTHPFLKEKV